MENRPIIFIAFSRGYPGVEVEVFQRFRKWQLEVYAPLDFDSPWVKERDQYQIIRENPEYPSTGTIIHYGNVQAWKDQLKRPETIDIVKERASWDKRSVAEFFWSAIYEFVKGFRTGPGVQEGAQDTRIVDNFSVLHFEGYRLSPDEQEKYYQWLSEYGYSFIPLFFKLQGLKGYDFFQDTGIRPNMTKENEYPTNLSLLYFDSIEAYENYAKSHELIMFQKTMRTAFPRGMVYKWYVQYQLLISRRK